MLSHLLVGTVHRRFVTTRSTDPALEVVGNKDLADALGTAAPVELDREQQERLRAIGYIQ